MFSTALLRLSLTLIVSILAILFLANILHYLGIIDFLKLKLTTFAALQVLLSAFLLLLVIGLQAICKSTLQTMRVYFAKSARIQRRLWFLYAKHMQLQHHFQHRIRYIHYVSELHRQRLLQADNRKQIRDLANAIDNDLLSIRTRLDKMTFQQLQQENKRYKKQQNGAALLALQEKIAAIALIDA